jgi:hypothetical protein
MTTAASPGIGSVRTLWIAETFAATIQGEGPSAGTPAMFIRTSSCNLDCAWCDTHSDRGSQYTGTAFRDACLDNGIIPSVGKTGICYDNAAAESWNATFKKELINLHAWKDVVHVRAASFEFVEVYYNRKRIQKSLGYLSPSEYELGFDNRMADAA